MERIFSVLFVFNISLICLSGIISAQPEAKASPVIQIPVEAISSNITVTQLPFEKTKPIEIEIKRASEATRIAGCKDLCGDGICQEIVCMAIGCPCPETQDICPQDCKAGLQPQPVEKVLPVISLPAQTKVEIIPTQENPILVNEKPVVFTGIEAPLPKISVEVKPTALTPFLTTVEIEIDKENKTIKIEHENVSAITKETIEIEEKTIKVVTPKQDIQINVLPAVAVSVVISQVPHEIKSVELKVVDEKPIYEIEGTKAGKLLWLIPVSFQIQTHVDAQTGETVKLEKPWWSFLVA
jgi:hypothetical protein